ncbi:uncharacterized protein LOC136078618 [Hydra vulgaris]|uniref:Uncharacterized protein LOC136078609 n=1 Tax=Hydra vulgaris TaxID=6087 RepID=A0ABM4BN02_HYDVU
MRSTIGQKRLSSLAIISIENEVANNIDFDDVIKQKPSEEVVDKNINVITSTSQATQQEEMLSVSINLEHKEISKDHNESRYKSNAYIFAHSNNLTTAVQVEETDPEPNIFQELNTLRTDMGYFKGKFLDDSTKRFIISSERCKPQGPFKKDSSQNFRHFSTNYYYCAYKFGRTQRFWLCYSKILDSAYCEPCWLFSNDKNNQWRTGVRDWKGLMRKQDTQPCQLEFKETFLGFYEIKDHSAVGLTNQLLLLLENKGIDLKKCRGQGYDEANVMSGIYNGVQKKINNIQPSAQYVHCASHNLNLVINDAVSGCREVKNFFIILQEIYSIFGNSIKRWDLLSNFSGKSEVTLKKLNPTRWSSRINSLLAIKLRFLDIVKTLTEISLKYSKKVEQTEALKLRDKISNFEFVFICVIMYHILTNVNYASKNLQKKYIDLYEAATLFGTLKFKLKDFRSNYDLFKLEAVTICNDLIKSAKLLQHSYPYDLTKHFPTQLINSITFIKNDITEATTLIDLADILLIKYSFMKCDFSDVNTAILLLMTIPVTVASAERSFSKLKIIKSYLRNSMSQERLKHCAILAIENEKAQTLELDEVIAKFANKKARKVYI